MNTGRVVLSLGLMLASVPALFSATVPRQSPEFVIQHPGGKQTLLSSFKGKVMVLEFIQTTCPHCQTTSQMLSKLQTEYGPRGFQAVGVAINPMSLMLVNDFVKNFRINFPVGSSEVDPALAYMQINGAERWTVPQILLIDKKGVIRMQSSPGGDERLSNEQFLRTEIEKMLKEGSAPAKAERPLKKRNT